MDTEAQALKASVSHSQLTVRRFTVALIEVIHSL